MLTLFLIKGFPIKINSTTFQNIQTKNIDIGYHLFLVLPDKMDSLKN